MINLDVYIDNEFYGTLNCCDDGDLPNHKMSQDHKLYSYWENQFLDGGTAHIIELINHKFFNNDRKEHDYIVARTLKIRKYWNGKEYRELCASKADDLVAKEWQTADGRRVVFKLSN